MNFKFKKDKVRILEPFAVFFIIIGIGINIILPLMSVWVKISVSARAEAVKGIWFFASISALAYSLIRLRYLFKQGVLDRLFYFIMAAIFVVLIVAAFYLP